MPEAVLKKPRHRNPLTGKKNVTLSYRRNFAGISLAAYKRLLNTAIEAAVKSGCHRAASISDLTGAGLAPHLAKVYSIWHKQQKKSMEKTIELLTQRKSWLASRKRNFSAMRKKLGDEKLDALFRVNEDGEITLDSHAVEGGVKLTQLQKESCLAMYPLYTLILGSPKEVRVKLAEALALKLS
jgi:hypothetical protein